MGGELGEDLGFFMVEDVEVEFVGCNLKANGELPLTGEKAVDSDRKELDLFAFTEPATFQLTGNDKKEESPGGDERGQAGDDISVSEENKETEPKERVQKDEETEDTKEEKLDEEQCLCLGPGEGAECHHVRISLQEVESFYRFSCRCHWICGGWLMFYHF